FPGVVLACALAERDGAMVHLVERNGKKAAFLREAVRITGAKATIHPVDIRDYVDKAAASGAHGIDCVTARAVAPLSTLLTLAQPLIARGATALFMKGQDIDTEVNEATRYWKFSSHLHSSCSGGGGWI